MTINKVLPGVDVELGGKARRLRMTLGSLARFQKETGVNFFEVGVQYKGSPVELQALVWACLVVDSPDLTPENVGDLIPFGEIERVTTALTEGWTAATPEGSDPLAATGGPSVGSTSGASEGSASD